MTNFTLKDSDEYYLSLSEQPVRFDADSPVTNVFFDDTNGEVFTVRSGGVTGVTVNGMDESKSTSFRMEDRGPIISIKFSPDHKILAIQRNRDNQNATVEFVNFKDLAPTNVEYAHSCKWKNAKILGFVWPKVNEIAFITDHGIELLQVLPDKKQLKSLKNTSFSCAWFSWCAQSKIVLLAGNNGALLQPFSLSNSTVSKLQKLELDAAKPVVERDVFLLRLCDVMWCAVFRHAVSATVSAPGPTEVWLMPVAGAGAGAGAGGSNPPTHVLKTGLVGRFAVNVVDDLVAVHHQSSQTSQLYDIMEESKLENNIMQHIPVVAGKAMRPSVVGDEVYPMYCGTWVMFQPDYIVDARLGCLWRLQLVPSGLAHSIPKEGVSKIVGVLLRRAEGRQTVYGILNQMIGSDLCLLELGKVFDEINSVYRRWAELEMARNTAGAAADAGSALADAPRPKFPVVISQADMCSYVLQTHAKEKLVQVVTAYLASLARRDMVAQHEVSSLTVRTLLAASAGAGARACARLRCLVRRGCLGDSRPLACQLLSLGHIDPAAAQLALDMMWRLRGYDEVVEVLLSWDDPVSAIGAARQAGSAVWHGLPARKILAAAKTVAESSGEPTTFLAAYHALRERNERLRHSPHFLKGEQCDAFVEYYKQLTSET